MKETDLKTKKQEDSSAEVRFFPDNLGLFFSKVIFNYPNVL